MPLLGEKKTNSVQSRHAAADSLDGFDSAVGSEAQTQGRHTDRMHRISFSPSVELPVSIGLLRDDTGWWREPAGYGEGGC